MKAKLAVVALLVSLIGMLGVVNAPTASATCSGGVCSQVKNADNSTKTIRVYCQANGYTTTRTLYAGQESGCGLYVYAMEVFNGVSIYCRPMGSAQPFVYYGGAGYYPFISNTRLTCLAV